MDEGSKQGSGPSSEVAIEKEDKEVEESGTSVYTYAAAFSVYIHVHETKKHIWWGQICTCTCSVGT